MTGTLAIDVGGTFTDVTFADAATGATWAAKTPSTPADLSAGFVTAVRKVLALAGRRSADVVRVFHGTTTATNAILEGKTPPTALVTTRGFKYVLEIGRHDIPRHGNLYGWSKPARPISPDRVFEVAERLDPDGAVHLPLDEAEARALARHLGQLGLPAVAVVFLHAYANPAHEARMHAILREEYPGVLVSLSSEVLPQFREFERTMATALNAAVMPPVSRYVGVLRDALDAEGVRAPLLIMKSDGGVTSAATCMRQPVQTVLSGPAAGVMGAVSAAGTAGFSDIISIDVGGTSADICLVRGGRPEITKDGAIGAFPLKLPIVDIHTIGAGGGSIAWTDAGGLLKVGPQSAGAYPGPAAYGRRGTLATVTDANVVLGRLNPVSLLGGRMAVHADKARAAIASLADRLEVDPVKAAAGVIEIINANMMGAVRVISVEQGEDPRDFALVAFGGAGPLHAADVARQMGMRKVLVPPRPGLLSAIGLLHADVRGDFSLTRLTSAGRAGLPALNSGLAALKRRGAAWLAGEGERRARFDWFADLRYLGQNSELIMELARDRLDALALAALVEAFHQRHKAHYGYDMRSQSVEVVNVRLVVTAKRRAAPREGANLARGDVKQALLDRRRVWFPESGFVSTPVYDRDRLPAGCRIAGPAIVEQMDATTLVPPGVTVRVDAWLNLVLEVAA
jgi:N-methylhydantoinase A